MSESPTAAAAESADEAEFTEALDADIWVDEPAGPSLVGRMVAELAGTFVLVTLGVGVAIFGSQFNNGSLSVGLAFGIAIIIMAIVVGAVSGAHFNPAVTVGVWLSGRFPGRDVVPYILAQVIGGLIAGAMLFWFGSTSSAFQTTGEGAMQAASNGFGEHSPAQFAADSSVNAILIALVVEMIATGLLVAVILGATSVNAPRGVAPFAIGLSIALIIVWAIPFTNASLNPARSTATALFAGSWAISQLWLFWVAPIVGAAIVGLLFRAFGSNEDVEIIEVVES